MLIHVIDLANFKILLCLNWALRSQTEMQFMHVQLYMYLIFLHFLCCLPYLSLLYPSLPPSLPFLSRGYLLSIVSSLQEDNESLQKMLQPQPDALRPLYVYESKMVSRLVNYIIIIIHVQCVTYMYNTIWDVNSLACE